MSDMKELSAYLLKHAEATVSTYDVTLECGATALLGGEEVSIVQIKNRKTKWSLSLQNIFFVCQRCKEDITTNKAYEVFDNEGASKGHHHYLCAERRIKEGR